MVQKKSRGSRLKQLLRNDRTEHILPMTSHLPQSTYLLARALLFGQYEIQAINLNNIVPINGIDTVPNFCRRRSIVIRGVLFVSDVFNNPSIFKSKADRSTLMSLARHGGHDNKIMYATLRTITSLTASLQVNRA